MKLLILADDFTGALDTGVQLSGQGISTTVFVSPDSRPDFDPEDCQVLSVNMETRHVNPKTAYEIVRSLLEKYAVPGRYVYLKTDSALRGTTGAAFLAALDTIGGPICFIPALPSIGRTTTGGTCYIKGVPLADSIFKNDPANPATRSYIPDILDADAEAIKGEKFNFEIIPVKKISEFDRILSGTGTPRDVYLFDCETDTQLRDIGNMLDACRMYGLTSGCAGFTSTFYKHLPLKTTEEKPKGTGRPLLIISGSANAVTIEQLAHAKHQGFPVFSLAADIYDCYLKRLADDEAGITDMALIKEKLLKEVLGWDVIQQTLSYLSEGQTVILAAVADQKDLKQNTDSKFHETVAFTTSSLVQLLLEEADPETLAVIGGDMVAAVLRQLECASVRAWGEVCAGVPLCTFSYRGRVRSLVTKSGAFGDADVISEIENYFMI